MESILSFTGQIKTLDCIDSGNFTIAKIRMSEVGSLSGWLKYTGKVVINLQNLPNSLHLPPQNK